MRAMKALVRNMAYALLMVVPGVGCLGCGQRQEDSASADRLQFTVADSLLGPVCEIAGAGKGFRPPRGFERPPDSVLAFVRTRFAARAENQGKRLLDCFIDTAHGAGVLVSAIDGLSFSSDTLGYFAAYRRLMHVGTSPEPIREGEYWVESVYVKNFLIVDSLNVRFNLLCLSAGGKGAELVYFAPRAEYAKLVRCFESSIGSLRVIKPGG